MPQNFSLREQTENITPTVVFADLQGRLSAWVPMHALPERRPLYLEHHSCRAHGID